MADMSKSLLQATPEVVLPPSAGAPSTVEITNIAASPPRITADCKP